MWQSYISHTKYSFTEIIVFVKHNIYISHVICKTSLFVVKTWKTEKGEVIAFGKDKL